MYGMFLAILAASIATVFAGIGSAKGVGGAAQTAMGVLSEDSSKFGKMLVRFPVHRVCMVSSLAS